MDDVVVSGYEIRKVKDHEKWLKLVHLQDGNLKRYTLAAGIGGDPGILHSNLIARADPGTTLLKEDLSNLKGFTSWNTQFSGVGSVRGHAVTYNRKLGVQAWVLLEVDLPQIGTRNVTALIGESPKEIVRDSNDLVELWSGTVDGMRADFRFGSVWPVEYNRRTRKHELIDRSLNPPPEPSVDTAGGGELQPSPPG